MNIAPKCPYCGDYAKLKHSHDVHPDRPQDYGNYWVCDPCDARIGCFQGTKTPLGRLANAELRRWKVRVHRKFDPLWRDSDWTRDEAHDWLRLQMGRIRPVNIGFLDVDECRQVVVICEAAVNG